MASILNYLFPYPLDVARAAARVARPSSSPWSALVTVATNALRLGAEIVVFVWMVVAVALAFLVAAGFLA
jgi:hypothetical protein